MKRKSGNIVVCAAIVSLACSGAYGAEWFEPHVRYSCDVSSAYISRGKVIEDRPIQINDLDVSLGLSDYGRIGFWHWNYSDLTGAYQDKHRRFVPECDWGLYYGYDWKIVEGWSLDTKIMVEWMTFYGGRPQNDPSSYEWRIQQTLKNPYVTPYYKFRYTLRPVEFAYYQVGLKRVFKVCEWLRLTPNVAMDFADSAGRAKRFGAQADGSPYGPGVLSLVAELTAEIPITDWFSLHATVGQFDVLSSDGRDTLGEAERRDLTYFNAGFTLSF